MVSLFFFKGWEGKKKQKRICHRLVCSLQSPKHLPSGPFKKKFANPEAGKGQKPTQPRGQNICSSSWEAIGETRVPTVETPLRTHQAGWNQEVPPRVARVWIQRDPVYCISTAPLENSLTVSQVVKHKFII